MWTPTKPLIAAASLHQCSSCSLVHELYFSCLAAARDYLMRTLLSRVKAAPADNQR